MKMLRCMQALQSIILGRYRSGVTNFIMKPTSIMLCLKCPNLLDGRLASFGSLPILSGSSEASAHIGSVLSIFHARSFHGLHSCLVEDAGILIRSYNGELGRSASDLDSSTK